MLEMVLEMDLSTGPRALRPSHNPKVSIPHFPPIIDVMAKMQSRYPRDDHGRTPRAKALALSFYELLLDLREESLQLVCYLHIR